ncbi:MAG: ABC transporter substrate-binding protein [SAR324 cluster bacterium]|uniref:ABC transporter substrate-binding protein n=1 Tax=SAR324 cluster bacterium TaxID=2024889 RepID=A0A7X9FUJ5_9DELT|nr:ABC transporter substrate-binding protein [SAR324 cluster bacterium]
MKKILLFKLSYMLIAGVVFFNNIPLLIAEPSKSAVISSSPLTEIKNTIDDILKVIEKYPGKENTSERRAKLRELINPRFNFREMSQRCLGPAWNEISVDEREDFVNVFSNLLARTYLSKIETVKPGMVQINSETIEASKALVRTTVKNNSDTFPIDYKLLNEDGQWRVYDVIIENIGLVSNYRNEFAGIIRKEKFEGLMVKLREKSATGV